MREKWTNMLKYEFLSFKNIKIESNDMITYFKNFTICYSLSEYVIAKLQELDTSEIVKNDRGYIVKDATILKIFGIHCIYNNKSFHYNELKHMNQCNERAWSEILNDNFTALNDKAIELSETLLKRYECRYVVNNIFDENFMQQLNIDVSIFQEAVHVTNKMNKIISTTEKIVEAQRGMNKAMEGLGSLNNMAQKNKKILENAVKSLKENEII